MTEMEERRSRLKASDFHPDVLRLFDQYVHGLIDRRGFLERATRFTVAGGSALALLEALSPRFAEAQQVAPQDKRLHAEYVELPSPHGYGKMRGYLVKPAKVTTKLPTVLVVHENRGLNPHIEDVTRRLALEQFMAFAPDALFPLGGYPGDEDKARELFAKLDQDKTREDFVAAAKFLKQQPEGNGRLGVVGFCYGGGVAHYLATRLPDLDAAVPFYGMAPEPQKAQAVKAPLLVHLAEQDERINTAWPAYEAALKAARVKFEVFKYPGTQHGFHNDTTPRYDEKAAKLAWQRTLALFNRTLRKPAPHPASDNPY
ncbi:MAG TPA: dienelactone hydrolase family protein [Polyangiaceae bacterium]|nr:dienelactone hydrolase family protein [Polyangiaceae bacterium]